MANDKKCIWLSVDIFPQFIAFCPSEKAWNREMKKMGCDEPYPFGDDGSRPNASGAQLDTFKERKMKDGIKKDVAIITVHAPATSKTPVTFIQIASLLAHEVVHFKQWTEECIGERLGMASETEAYYIQSILQQCLYAYQNTIGFQEPKVKRGKSTVS